MKLEESIKLKLTRNWKRISHFFISISYGNHLCLNNRLPNALKPRTKIPTWL